MTGAPVCTCGAEREATERAYDALVGGFVGTTTSTNLFMEMGTGKPKPQKAKRFLGEPKCSFCGATIAEEGAHLYDAATVFGPWAKMCDGCWILNGRGLLGVGHGQMYEVKSGLLVKVAG
jgi:hypothetical protein